MGRVRGWGKWAPFMLLRLAVERGAGTHPDDPRRRRGLHRGGSGHMVRGCDACVAPFTARPMPPEAPLYHRLHARLAHCVLVPLHRVLEWLKCLIVISV